MEVLVTRYQNIENFIRQMESQSSDCWQDQFGRYEVTIGSHIIESELEVLHPRHLIVAEDLPEALVLRINAERKAESDYAISIGSSLEHNELKLQFSTSDVSLVTMPVPLTNDSFGTNRYSKGVGQPSVSGQYPCKTVFDIGLLSTFPWSVNKLALGEFVGLYYSVIDYFESRTQAVPTNLLALIVEYMHSLFNLRSLPEQFVRKSAIALLLKCLVMRVTGDHQVACGIDHLISYSIDPEGAMSHGKAVYLGSIVSAALYPRWNMYGIGFYELIEIGMECQLISAQDLLGLASYDPGVLIRRALDSRHGRRSVLQVVARGGTVLRDAWKRFETVTNKLKLNG